MRSAFEIQALMPKKPSSLDRWLDAIDTKIEDCIHRNQSYLRIDYLSSLNHLFLDAFACKAVIKTLQELGYHVTYYPGTFSRPKYLLISWLEAPLTQKEEEIQMREAINQELEALQKSLNI